MSEPVRLWYIEKFGWYDEEPDLSVGVGPKVAYLAIPLTDLEKCKVDCPECGGKKQTDIFNQYTLEFDTIPCPRCGGKGYVIELPGSVME